VKVCRRRSFGERAATVEKSFGLDFFEPNDFFCRRAERANGRAFL
jgi:hypothetical protein